MLFGRLMHVAFFTSRMEEMIAFYTDKLEGRIKVLVKYGEYLDRDDRPAFQQIAREDPDRIFNVYIEVAEGQFIELFPLSEAEAAERNGKTGYDHFALTVNDIFETRRILEEKGIVFDTEISKGPSGTYQMWLHDPDGNRFEIMQYTAESYQVKGHVTE